MGCESKRDKIMAKVNAIINADSPSTAPSRVKLGRLRSLADRITMRLTRKQQ
jgi:hypothetical protein